MELLGLLAIGFVIGIPVMAIVALVRSNTVRRLVDDSSFKIADLRGEIADLKRELKLLAERVEKIGEITRDAASVRSERSQQTAQGDAAAPQVEQSAAQPSVAVQPEPAIRIVAPPPSPPPPPPVAPVTLRPAEQPISPPAPDVAAHRPAPGIAAFQAAAPAAPPAAAPTPQPIAASAAPAVRPSSQTAPQLGAPQPAPPVWTPAPIPSFASYEAPPPRESFFAKLRANLPLEEVLGMNLFAKVGIVLLVLGFALLGRVALISMGPGARVALIYAVAGAMLGGGIWAERRERYRLVGRTGIGGGWALLFFTTYAMHHVAAMMVLSSNTLDCILMLVVAVAMVAHTLRYRSQLVTGLAFLLAFSTVALSQDSVYALVAGVILAVSIVAIALKMSWFELEVFGILASYGNHFYWLYKLYPDGVAGHAFPEFWPSAIILMLYWAIFRASYIVRRIGSPRDESISTVAALLNTILLGAVLKFQSTHPELAFYALLGLGAVEFTLGQLPITRRRRAAFALLTVIGSLLIFAAAPFKFSGNNIALFWMIAAEALLIAGIVQLEVLFRRLGLLGGVLTGLLVAYESWSIVTFRAGSEAPLVRDGVLLLTCSLPFYLNAHFIRPKWHDLFGNFDGWLATLESYLGGVTAFLGVWAIFTADWTAIGWAALLLGAAFGTRYLKNNHLLVQACALAAAVGVRAIAFNFHLSDPYPHHIAVRVVTIAILALTFYAAAWALSGAQDASLPLYWSLLWGGSALLAILTWLEVAQPWVAPVWVALALVLCLVGRRFQLAELTYQEHVLAAAAAVLLFFANIDAQTAVERYVPLLGCAAAFYAVSRFSTQANAACKRPAAWIHTWGATALVASLAWHESPQPWLAVIWVLLALALAIFDRIFDVEELPYQAHVLALLAVVRAVTLNYFIEDKWHGVHLRLVTIAIVVAALYALARWVRMPQSLRDSEARHAYTWAAAGLAAWLLWRELQPISVALGLGVFGLLLFEIGAWRKQRQLRLQAYALFAASFLRIFFVNLTAATLPGEALSPRIYTVAPLALIFFYVWARLQSEQAKPEIGRWSASDLIAYFGTGSIVAILYYQVSPEWIVVAWAILVLALIGAAFFLDKEVFLQQAILLTVGIAGRGFAHNIFGASYFVGGGWRGKFSVLSLTVALLLSALPIAFRIRDRYRERPRLSWLSRCLAVHRPEQTLFFAPIALIVFTIAVKMNPGMVTLAWGIVGVAVILLGLIARERSYRLTGLLLLVLCVGKIVILDAWNLSERDRYVTFIVLGGALTLVSTLYSKYRDTVRRLL
jgi:uncharacterized membrane protein